MQTQRCDVYGQGSGFPQRSMLIYDGLHYDALALAGALARTRQGACMGGLGSVVRSWPAQQVFVQHARLRRAAPRRPEAGWWRPLSRGKAGAMHGCWVVYEIWAAGVGVCA